MPRATISAQLRQGSPASDAPKSHFLQLLTQYLTDFLHLTTNLSSLKSAVLQEETFLYSCKFDNFIEDFGAVFSACFQRFRRQAFFSLWFEEKYYFGSLYAEINGTASSRLSPYDISK